jgi:hypothetical protein
MPSSGGPLICFALGLVLAAGGFVTFFVILAISGGLPKSRTFAVIGSLTGPRKTVLRVGMLAMVFGGLMTCSGVAMSDGEVRTRCVDDCKRVGYAEGRVGAASQTATGPSCWCVGPAGSAELRPAR